MATIISRGGKWRAQIRRDGVSLSKTFNLKRDASLWAKLTELELDRGVLPTATKTRSKTPSSPPSDERTAPLSTTLGTLIERYRDTVTPKKKGNVQETYWLNAFLKHTICSLELSELKTGHFAGYRDERLAKIKPVTLKRQLAVIHNAFEVARDEWSIPLGDNPLDKLRFKAQPVRRERRLRCQRRSNFRPARRSKIRPAARLAL
jgi:hypothetical protein